MTTDAKMQTLYDNLFEFTGRMSNQYDAYEIAGVMMAQALSIYKSSMSETEFNMMVDTISESRRQVQTFERKVLQ